MHSDNRRGPLPRQCRIGMARQVGFALGVALLIAALGTATTPSEVLDAFVRGWWLMVGVAVLAALVSPRLTPRTSASA